MRPRLAVSSTRFPSTELATKFDRCGSRHTLRTGEDVRRMLTPVLLKDGEMQHRPADIPR